MEYKAVANSYRGFTLIELLVVISIISILAVMATINFDQARASARDAKRVAEITQLRAGFEVEASAGMQGLYPEDWPPGVVNQLNPSFNTAYCYYSSLDHTNYLLIVVGIEGTELAALGSPIGEEAMAQAAAENAVKINGDASCPAVDSVNEVNEITLLCAELGNYCLVGGY